MKRNNISLVAFAGLLMICFILLGIFTIVLASDLSEMRIEGSFFESADKNGYGVLSADSFSVSKYSGSSIGDFFISGNLVDDGFVDGVHRFGVNGGNVNFFYVLPETEPDTSDDQWQIVLDKSQAVGDIKIGASIQKGVLILQVSKDGINWIDERIIPNYIDHTTDKKESFYTTSDIQLANGYYYKLILAYRLGKQTGKSKVLVVETEEYEYKKISEVYSFYLYDSNQSSKRDYTLSKTLGQVKKTGNDNGYAGNFEIKIGDPHYGWKLGHFFVSGYTRAISETDRPPVFLKNVGDEVTLWFNLEQNISKLNGDENLSISEDKNGYDQFFQIPKTNLGRGALIIRYTDEKGIKHDPEIYTNFLEANSLITADTIVKLFEEGDYEVALNYEIKNTPRKVGIVEVIPEYSNYRIFFEFSVRNGNSMVYPFDLVTGSELSDQAITANGFRLDMARSRYLTIDVTRSVLKASSGGLVEDVRFNRPAKDGDEYTAEGIYTFKVKNLYTGEETQKTIYVGESSELRALSVNKISIPFLNEQIGLGASISSDGKILLREDEIEPEASIVESDKSEEVVVNNESTNESDAVSTDQEAESQTAKPSKSMFGWIGIICLCGILLFTNKERIRKIIGKGV